MIATLRSVGEPTVGTASRRLRSLLRLLGELFLAHNDSRGTVILDLLNGSDDELARRTLSLFTRGMGGLTDAPLYQLGTADKIGQPAVVDGVATKERDRLADDVWDAARNALGAQDLRFDR